MIKEKSASASRPDTRQYSPEESLVVAWNKLLHIVRIHDDTNELVHVAAVDFVRSIRRFSTSSESVSVEGARGRFYIQDKKLLHRNETVTIIQSLLGFLESIGVTGFRFSVLLDKRHLAEAVVFTRILNQAVKRTEPLDWITAMIESKGLSWVQVISTQEEKVEDDVEESKKRARRVYSSAYNSVSDVTQKIAAGKRAGIRKSVRVVQDMADMVTAEDPLLLGLSAIKDYDNYTYTHSVNVAILSMCLGERIGLSKKSLIRLGLCGLFHDLGKVDIALDIINKPGRLTESEVVTVQQHSLNSVRQILKLQTFRKLKAQIILPPFEHHLKYDLSGYPKVNWSNPVSLFGRIIAIADVYDALSSVRSYRPVAVSQDRALGIMLEGSGRDFDPLLLKWFINMVGIYPVGTLLEFSDGQMGLVVEGRSEGDSSRPRVVLLASDNTGGYKRRYEMELSRKNPATGEYLLTVSQSYNPAEKGIRVADFLL